MKKMNNKNLRSILQILYLSIMLCVYNYTSIGKYYNMFQPFLAIFI
jgi:hypothetical protein